MSARAWDILEVVSVAMAPVGTIAIVLLAERTGTPAMGFVAGVAWLFGAVFAGMFLCGPRSRRAAEVETRLSRIRSGEIAPDHPEHGLDASSHALLCHVPTCRARIAAKQGGK